MHTPRRFASIVLQHFSIFLAHCYQELVNGHGRVDRDFAAKERFDFMRLHFCVRSLLESP